MPIIEFHLLEGRSVEQKRRLCSEVTSAVMNALGVRRDQVRILIHNIPTENFSAGGTLALDRANEEATNGSGLKHSDHVKGQGDAA